MKKTRPISLVIYKFGLKLNYFDRLRRRSCLLVDLISFFGFLKQCQRVKDNKKEELQTHKTDRKPKGR